MRRLAQQKKDEALLSFYSDNKKKTQAMKRYSDERLHDLGILFIQQQRDRKKEILKRAREDSGSGAPKRDLKRRFEQYKASSENASGNADSDDEPCKSSFEEMMEIDRIIQAKWEKISTLVK